MSQSASDPYSDRPPHTPADFQTPAPFLTALLDKVSEGFAVVDRTGYVAYTNQAFADLFGKRPGDLIGRSIRQEIPEAVDSQLYQEVQRAMDNNQTIEFEEYFRSLDAWFQIRLLPSTEGVFVSTHEVTQAKQTKNAPDDRTRALALSAEIGRALTSGDTLQGMLQGCAAAIVQHFDAAFARVWTLNSEDNVLELQASAGLYTHLDGGHSRVPVGKFKIGLIAQECKPHLTNSVIGDPLVGEQEWAKREGMVAFAGYPLLLEGRVVGVVAMFARKVLSQAVLDALMMVSDEIALGIVRKQVEIELASSREWLATTLSSIGDAVIATDCTGNVIFMNPIAAALTGWTQEEAFARPLTQIFHIIDEITGEPAANPVDRVIQEGQIVGLANHTALVARDGTLRPIDDSAAPICGAEGGLVGVVLVFHDVTERRQAERRAEAQYRVSTALAAAVNVEQATEHAMAAIGDSLGWTLGVLWLQSPETQELRAVQTWVARAYSDGKEAHFADMSAGMTFEPGRGLPGKVLASRQLRWIERITDFTRFPRLSAAHTDGLRSVIAFPLLNGESPIGVMEFFHTDIRLPDEEMIQTLQGIGHQIGQFIERRRTEEDAIQSGALQTAILSSALDCVVSMDHLGRVVEWNSEAARTFGYTREEALGQELAALIIPPSLRARHRLGLQNYLNTGEGLVIGNRIEITGVHRDGTEFPVELAISRIAGEPPRFTGFIRNITEQKQTQDALIESEARYQRIAANVPGMVYQFVLHPDGSTDFPFVSDYSKELYGIEPEAIKADAMRLIEIIHPDDKAAFNQSVIDSATTLQAWKWSGRFLHPTGDYRWIEGASRPQKEANGDIMWDGLLVDITKRKQTEAELLEAKEAAEAATLAKSQFLATMSHEIRTPMNAVIGMTGLLLDTQLTPQQQEYAQIIHDSGDALLTVINDILDFSKIEAGQMELERQPFDLRDCVESALDLVAARASEQGLDIAYVMSPDVPPTVMGDVTRVRQILVNLLSNAVKFTEQGEVVLAVSSAPLASGQYEILFDVRDTGIGIPPNRMDRLFRSFSQVDASTTRRYGGSGLGLIISKRICEMMGGRIWAESTVGVGSTFHVALPATVSLNAVHAPLVPDDSILDGRRILIVDDNETNRQILCLQAENWGIAAQECATASQALALVRGGERFDVAILDIQMPDIDGITLAKEINVCCGNLPMPLIGLSSVSPKLAEVAQAGFAEMLTKPIKQSQLYNVLANVLSGQTRTSRLPEQGSFSAPSVYNSELGKRLPLRILVAEDLGVNQKLMQGLLAKFGYRADMAGNGIEVLQALKRQQYDVILMDVQMPEMDGLEAARQINLLYGAERPRIVALTANAMREDREICIAAGMDDYLAKPVKPDAVREALARCGEWRQSRETKAVPVQENETSGTDAQRQSKASRQFSAADDDPNKKAGNTALVEEIIDAAFLKDIRMMRDVLPELIMMLRTDVYPRLDIMRAAVANQDPSTLAFAAHGVKGAVGSVGGRRLATLCHQLEEMGRAGTVEGADALFPEIEVEYERLCTALQQVAGEEG